MATVEPQGAQYITVDDTVWPVPVELEWVLRYGEPSKAELLPSGLCAERLLADLLAVVHAAGRHREVETSTPRPQAVARQIGGDMSNTHYAVLAFSGDPAGEHPDPDLRGQCPSLTLIASGPEDFCWNAVVRWTADHPLRMWEEAEVLERHPSVVRTADGRMAHDT